MRHIYENPVDIIPAGLAATLRARTQWTWNSATRKILTRLDALCGTSMAREAGAMLDDTIDGISLVANAEAMIRLGDIDAAIKYFIEAVGKGALTERYTILALARLAYISLQNGDTEMAEQFLDKAATLNAGHPDIVFVRALILSQQQRYEEVMTSLTPVMEQWKTIRFDTALGVSLDMILCEVGNAALCTGGPEDALQLYTHALKLNGENADACYGAARALTVLGAEDQARTMLEWALRLRPDFEEAELDLAAL